MKKLLKYIAAIMGVAVLLASGYFLTAKDFRLVVMTGSQDEISRALIWRRVNTADEYGRTPLMYAVATDDELFQDDLKASLKQPLLSFEHGDRDTLAIVKLLLEAGAEVNAQDKKHNTPLMAATMSGDATVVKALIKAGADVNFKYDQGDTVLMEAVSSEHLAVVKALTENGANVNVADVDGVTALMIAVELNEDSSIVEHLVKAGANVNATNKQGDTPLLLAVADNDVNNVKLLLDAKADVAVTNRDGQTPALLAVEAENPAILTRLIQAGADLNAADSVGDTPLIHACRSGSLEMVELLLKAKADANKTNKNGDSALHIVVQDGRENLQILDAILAAGAKLDLLGADGQTPLYCAAVDGRMSYVSRLCKAGANAGLAPKRSGGILRVLIGKASADVIELALKAGADPNCKDKFGITPLFYAVNPAFCKDSAVAEVLIKYKAKVNAANSQESTPLLAAVDHGASADLIRSLIKHGANVNARASGPLTSGETPLMIMAQCADSKRVMAIMPLLLEAGAKVDLKDLDGKTALDYAKANKDATPLNLLQQAIKGG